jgi:hypothetical protein
MGRMIGVPIDSIQAGTWDSIQRTLCEGRWTFIYRDYYGYADRRLYRQYSLQADTLQYGQCYGVLISVCIDYNTGRLKDAYIYRRSRADGWASI